MIFSSIRLLTIAAVITSSIHAFVIPSYANPIKQTPSNHRLSSSPQIQNTTISTSDLSLPSPPQASLSKTMITPRHLSILLMSTAMALHFFGYEFARSSALTLFTSDSKTGFLKFAGAFPLAMACISPVSLGMLFGYGRELQGRGPRRTLMRTTFFCAGFLTVVGLCIQFLQYGHAFLFGNVDVFLLKGISWTNFVFQNCYAHLLYTQYFSFIGSVSTSEEGAAWFSIIAGLTSISSTIAAVSLSRIVHYIGVTGLLYVASFSLLLSMLCGDRSYAISEKHGFDPTDEIQKRHCDNKEKRQNNIMWKASDIFQRVPVLKALFLEVLTFQSLSSILNVCFVRKLQYTITSDVQRAAWMGNFYAVINGTCGVLQFLILPILFKRLDPKWVWRAMPLILFSLVAFQNLQTVPSLLFASLPFFAMKVMDYSSRATANELVYVPLDFESRYVGKEIIGVFGNGFGKSGMSLVLAAITSFFGNNLPFQKLSYLASVTWLASSVHLSNLLPKNKKED